MTVLRWTSLTKEDTRLYKGLAILMIVFHNYFHWVKPKISENEFVFISDRIVNLFALLSGQPFEAIHLLFSYLGHYGVVVFIFLSAYGLTVSYGDKDIKWFSFMGKRLYRIYPAFFMAIIVHAVMLSFTEPGGFSLWYLKIYIVKLSLLSNFIPDMALSVNGPWWFFSCIVQFYAIFPLLNRIAVRHGNAGLLSIGVTGLITKIIVSPLLLNYDLNLLYTVAGYLPEISLGIYAARIANLQIKPMFLIAVLLLFITGNWFKSVWNIASLCSLILLLTVFQTAAPCLKNFKPGYAVISYFGMISLQLFAVHGVLRLPFVKRANEYGDWFLTIALGLIFLLVSASIAHVMFMGDTSGRRWIKKRVSL